MSVAIIMVLVVVTLATIACRALARDLRIERERLRLLELWIRANLLIIRCECAFMSPQGASIVTSLERALPALVPVDAVGLRRDLARIQRKHDAVVVEQTRHWSAVQAHVAAEAARGAPLPGFNGEGGSS